jgi:hypothetical protein
VSVVVLGVELLFDALLELLEDLFERLLFLGERDRFLLVGELGLQLGGEIEEVVFVGEEILLLRRGAALSSGWGCGCGCGGGTEKSSSSSGIAESSSLSISSREKTGGRGAAAAAAAEAAALAAATRSLRDVTSG